MDLLDKQIKDYLKKEIAMLQKSGTRVISPDAEDFYEFITEKLEGKALDDFMDYLSKDEYAQTIVRKARALAANEHESDGEKVPDHWFKDAKNLLPKGPGIHCPHCGKGITPFKSPAGRQQIINFLWLGAAAASFIASFFYKHYFYQFLALSLFFGIKWAIDQKAARAQILIYKALKEEGSSDDSRDLHKHSSRL